MARVIHFEIPAKDLKKQREFYSKVFEWKIEKREMPEDYWLIGTGDKEKPGINGAFYNGISGFGLKGTIFTVDVEDIDKVLKKVVEGGGKVVTEKMPIPRVGTLAYASDLEGTIFGVMQSDPNRKM